MGKVIVIPSLRWYEREPEPEPKQPKLSAPVHLPRPPWWPERLSFHWMHLDLRRRRK